MRAKPDRGGGGKNDQEGAGGGRGLPGVAQRGRASSTCLAPAAEGPPPSPRPPGCRREEMRQPWDSVVVFCIWSFPRRTSQQLCIHP